MNLPPFGPLTCIWMSFSSDPFVPQYSQSVIAALLGPLEVKYFT
jgi:hypothetical protein